MDINQIINGDCLEIMPSIPDKSIDMILCDLPYGTTACSWDTVIPFEPLWTQYKRIIKDNGAIVLTGSEPFSSYLRLSNIKDYKYDWIWNKKLAGNGILAKRQPLKIHEIVSVFNSNIYIPQKTKGKFRKKMGLKESEITGGDTFVKQTENNDYYPVSIQEFSLAGLRTGRLHPTQKPVALFEYLIKTYTNEEDLVLDNCAGSGTTGVAAKNLKRNFVLIEKEQKYVEIARERIKNMPEKLL
jgi:DNA modification methylase